MQLRGAGWLIERRIAEIGMIKRYRPNGSARIEAMELTSETATQAMKWAGNDILRGMTSQCWMVKTLEGWVEIPFGHYLIRGTHGEFYPCDPVVFQNRWIEV